MQAQMNSGVAQQPPQRARVLPPSKTTRLAYIDWMRGLACVLMFPTHCYDSWINPAARKSSSLIIWSQLRGTLPSPLFIFLAGVSFALVTERMREKGVERHAIAKQTILRGAEIFGMGLLFRAQEFALGYPWSPWSDLLRVDVADILGLSVMRMGLLCWATGDGAMAIVRRRTLVGGVLAAAAVAFVTPLLWTTHRPKFLPWPLESYINGVHIFDQPQPWLFPLFPWSAFAFAGLATGFYLFSDFAEPKQGLAFAACLLGDHPVCLLKVFDSAQGIMRRAQSHRGIADDFSGDGAAFRSPHNVEKAKAQGFAPGSCGNCSDCGILMITSPGLARPNSSRAIVSILRGSLFSSLTSSSSCTFSLLSRSLSAFTFLISCCVRRIAR